MQTSLISLPTLTPFPIPIKKTPLPISQIQREDSFMSPIKRAEMVVLFLIILTGLLVTSGSLTLGLLFNIPVIYFLTGLTIAAVFTAILGLHKLIKTSLSCETMPKSKN